MYKYHSRKFSALICSFSSFGFLFLPSGSLNRWFSIQNFPLSSLYENSNTSQPHFPFIVIFPHLKVTSMLYTCHLTTLLHPAANLNSTHKLTISGDWTFPQVLGNQQTFTLFDEFSSHLDKTFTSSLHSLRHRYFFSYYYDKCLTLGVHRMLLSCQLTLIASLAFSQ